MAETNIYAPPGSDPGPMNPENLHERAPAGRARALAWSRGYRWVMEAFGLFKRGALPLLTIALVHALFLFAVARAPVDHASDDVLVWAVALLEKALRLPLFAVYMVGYGELDHGRPIRVARVVAALRARIGAVLGATLIYVLVLEGLMIGDAFLLVPFRRAFQALSSDDLLILAAFGAAKWVVEEIPVALAFLLVPPLLVLSGVGSLAAIRVSAAASFKNMGPLLVCNVVLVLVGIALAAPLLAVVVLGFHGDPANTWLPAAVGSTLMAPIVGGTRYCFYREALVVATPASSHDLLEEYRDHRRGM